ncbi:hypothetical protein G7084_00125 [Weissella coleopterorum]|uniref:Uncharacterized protein n=1 Tax=Weissella coleopterorum TaxID=2714949 RepID=A0A6G8AXY9_9LACO|nr:hypothetical protein [Weissella coleopterorum]QIL49866.1 hypothetical protein G7084_00125 [Weissella coleopterorum]
MMFSYRKKRVSVHDGHLDAEGVLTEDEKEMLSKELYSGAYERTEKEPIEPFTADEALNKTIDGMDESFELLRNKAFKEINEAIKRGEYQTRLTTYFHAHDINAKRLSDYLIELGYKAELDTDGLYAGQEPVYRLIVDWGDEDENA